MIQKSVILLLGGNQGNVMQVLSAAIGHIEKETGRLQAVSHVYRTSAWGPVQQPDFLNIAIQIRTIMPAGMLMKKLLEIEKRFGRKRDVKYGPRTLDIDLLFYGQSIVHSQSLQVPHPEIQNRRFALQPCADIAPGFIHPVFKKSISELLKECKDELEVQKWKY